MSATAKKRTHARIDRRRTVCHGGCQYQAPLRAARPVVVFCPQCQSAKDVR